MDDLSPYAKKLIRYKALQLVGSYGVTRDDEEDIRQDLTLAVLEALAEYDPRKGASRNTFAARVTDQAIVNMVKHRTLEKRDYRTPVCSLSDEVGDGDNPLRRDETIGQDECDLRTGKSGMTEEDRIDLRLDVARALRNMPDKQKRLATCIAYGMSVDMSAWIIGEPRSTAFTWIPYIRAVLECHGLADYL